MALQGGLTIAAGWAQARMSPQINFAVEARLFEATTAVELGAFDDAGFAEEMERARERGMLEAASLVDSTVNLTTGAVGVVATAAAVTVIEPLLLPCLVLAALPAAVTALKVARREYISLLSRITRRRRLWMLAGLMANRETATEVRTYQMRGFLLDEHRRVMRTETRGRTGPRTVADRHPSRRHVTVGPRDVRRCTRRSAACCSRGTCRWPQRRPRSSRCSRPG